LGAPIGRDAKGETEESILRRTAETEGKSRSGRGPPPGGSGPLFIRGNTKTLGTKKQKGRRGTCGLPSSKTEEGTRQACRVKNNPPPSVEKGKKHGKGDGQGGHGVPISDTREEEETELKRGRRGARSKKQKQKKRGWGKRKKRTKELE